MSVNLSAQQVYQPNLIENIDRIIETTGINPKNLKLELTETAIIDDSKLAQKVITQLKSRHIQLSLDDFGTGYSSLSYLHQFDFDTLKIDRAFVNLESLSIAKSMISLAHSLDMDVVAEGIETPEQQMHLHQLGCEYGQGYLFAKPLDRESIDRLLRDRA